MISLNWDRVNGEIGSLVQRFSELPRHIGKKHLKAAIGRTLRPGVPLARKLTPPTNTRRGRRKKGEKAASTGALRRAIKVKTKYIGRNSDGKAYGVIGYRAGEESQKALWLEFGTKRIRPREFMQQFQAQYYPVAKSRLAAELRRALDAAARDRAPGPGYRRAGR